MYGFKHYDVRLRIVGAIAAAVIVAAALALPADSQTHGSPWAAVTGSGKVTFANFPQPGVNTTEQFNVAAHNGPNGPSGTIVVHSPLYSVDPESSTLPALSSTATRRESAGSSVSPLSSSGARSPTSESSSGTTGRPAQAATKSTRWSSSTRHARPDSPPATSAAQHVPARQRQLRRPARRRLGRPLEPLGLPPEATSWQESRGSHQENSQELRRRRVCKRRI